MKIFLLWASVSSAGILIGDIFTKELNQNQLISLAGAGTITSIWYLILRIEELLAHYFKEKSS